MTVPNRVFYVMEKRPDGRVDCDCIEFKTFEEANEHAIELCAKATAKKIESSFTVVDAVWIEEIKQ